MSKNGILVYKAGDSESRLVWKDRKGTETGQVGSLAKYQDIRLSPDGKKVAASIRDPRTNLTDIWIVELDRNVATRFTSDASDASTPIWSPDGSRIIYCKPDDAPPFLHQKPLIGGEEEVLLPSRGTVQCPADWSPDGRSMVYVDRGPNTSWDLWILPLGGEGKPIPLLRTRFREGFASFSPDGRRLAYVSDESGRLEVYVQPFPGPGERRRISTAGGSLPRWRRDGEELFYLSADDQVMSVPVMPGARFEPGTPTALFTINPPPGVFIEYDVSPDGQRFLVNSAIPGTEALPVVVLNWTAGLNK